MANDCRSWPRVKVPLKKGLVLVVGEQINLEGWDCFDAAVHCAAICAGQRGSKALNLAKPDALPPPAHAVVATASLPSMEPYYPMEDSQEIPGCWKLLRETVSNLWCVLLQQGCLLLALKAMLKRTIVTV